jgi:phage tail tape-measure protein
LVVGVAVGSPVGVAMGESVGSAVGFAVGSSVGAGLGESVGSAVGFAVGSSMGTGLGASVGFAVGSPDGSDGCSADNSFALNGGCASASAKTDAGNVPASSMKTRPIAITFSAYLLILHPHNFF